MARRVDERYFADHSARTLVDVCAKLASKCEGDDLAQVARNLTAVAEWFAEVISWREQMPQGISAPTYRVENAVYADIVYALAWADTLFPFRESGIRKQLSGVGLSFIHPDIKNCATEEGMKNRNPRTSRAITTPRDADEAAQAENTESGQEAKRKPGRPARDTSELWQVAQGLTGASMEERFKALNTLHRRFQKILKGHSDLDV